MALVNHTTREINAKIVYYGPGLCGKTTNIHLIYHRIATTKHGKLISLATETYRTLFDFAGSLGKEPIAAKDTSGFIVNLLLVPYLLDAVRALERGVGTVPDIDKGMMLGCGYPMGPFTLLDFVGLDTTYKIAEIMFAEYREARYAPPPLLKRMVLAGMYGKKSGKGFYDYSASPPTVSELGL